MFSFTVATLNLNAQADRWLARRHLLVGQILDTTPDIIALQSISLGIGQGGWLARQINYRLTDRSRRPYRLIQARRLHPRRFFEGIGVMTRLPVIYQDTINLGIDSRVALRVNIEIPAEKSVQRRQSLDFVCVQLADGVDAREARLEQMMKLVGWVNEKRRNHLQIIAGGFNELPDGPAIQFMRQSYRSAYSEKNGRDPLATYPTNLIRRPISIATCLDYVFVSSAVYRVADAKIFCDKPATDDETLYPSDHVGLLVSLEV